MLDLARLREVTQASRRRGATPGPALSAYLIRAVFPTYPADAVCLTSALLPVDEFMGISRASPAILAIRQCRLMIEQIYGRHG
jgi:hypothetical protein